MTAAAPGGVDDPPVHPAACGADWLPPEAPLAMPVQDLWGRPALTLPEPRRGLNDSDLWRAAMIGLAAAMTFFPANAALEVYSEGGLTGLEVAELVLFVLLFGWLAFAFVMAATGFCLMITGGGDDGTETGPDTIASPAPRTAVLAPIYNEDPTAVFARLQAMRESLLAAGAQGFELFVLSDTRAEPLKPAEEAAFAELRRRPGPPVFYRRRSENVGRKAGNIAEWVRRFGAAYAFMVVLDADSLMEGETLTALAASMARQPRLGLLQTVPMIVNRNTLFARLLQFASRLYGPMLSEGLAWWSGAEGNYWGHNAIIRVQAFADQAGLPRLPGRRPFGGEILSHDFVEAALLRRAGWEVRMAPQLTGSFEECPPTLPDMLVRERRWCQGNLQHSVVIAARGLHWTSRLHLIRGVSAYLTSPLWLAFVVVGAVQAALASRMGAAYDLASLRVLSWVLALGFGALWAPKLMSLGLVFLQPEERRAWGHPLALLAGFALELVVSILTAPILMLAQTETLILAAMGKDAGWNPQRRGDDALSWLEALRLHGLHSLAGIVVGVAAYVAAPATLLWLLPVVAGLVLAAPLAWITSSRKLGVWLRLRGVLTIPEERNPPDILQRFTAEAGETG